MDRYTLTHLATLLLTLVVVAGIVLLVVWTARSNARKRRWGAANSRPAPVWVWVLMGIALMLLAVIGGAAARS